MAIEEPKSNKKEEIKKQSKKIIQDWEKEKQKQKKKGINIV